MPTFGRLGKQSNRPQQAAFEPREAGAPPPPRQSNRQGQAQAQAQAQARARAVALAQQQQEADDDGGHPQPQPHQHPHPPSLDTSDLPSASPLESAAPHSAIASNAAAFSSSESFDTRRGPAIPHHNHHQSQQQQSPLTQQSSQAPPSSPYNTQSAQLQPKQQEPRKLTKAGGPRATTGTAAQQQQQHSSATYEYEYRDPSATAAVSSLPVASDHHHHHHPTATAAPPGPAPLVAPPPPLHSSSSSGIIPGTPIASEQSPTVAFDNIRSQRGYPLGHSSSPDPAQQAAPVNRSQSQRHSTFEPLHHHVQQQHQHQQQNHPQSTPPQDPYSPHPYHSQQQGHQFPQGYPTGSTSLDNLPDSTNYPSHVVVHFPEKHRSARKFIKGIFGGGSNRSTSNAAAAAAADHSRANSNAGTSPGNHSLEHVSGQPPNFVAPPGSSPIEDDPRSPINDPNFTQDPGTAFDTRQGLSHKASTRASQILLDHQSIRPVSQDIETPVSEDAPFPQAQLQPPPSHHQQNPQGQASPLQQQPLHAEDQQRRFGPSSYEPQAQGFGQQYQQQPQPPLPPQLQHQQTFSGGQNPHAGVQAPGPDPRVLGAAHLSTHHPQHSVESLSQVSFDSRGTDSDPSLSHHIDNLPSPAPAHPFAAGQDPRFGPRPPPGHLPSAQQQQAMAPPSGGQPSGRRAPEADKAALRGQMDPSAGHPAYRHSGAVAGGGNPQQGPPAQGSGPGPRGDRMPPQFENQVSDAGVNSHPSQNSEGADPEKFKELLTKYKNVKRLYFDGKSQIEGLTAQVEQLQNAVANQRITSSRTAWDDNEYSTRFNRLNGAINNLSFNIRKDWRSLPPWLEGYVSAEALKTGKQEMTAIGRAVISRWLVEEVFDRCFHPGLEPGLSSQLKEIELSIRGNAYTMHTQEEFDALTKSIVSWRMTTLDGLQKRLNSPETADYRQTLTSKATSNLTAMLYQHLNNPPPTGVEGSTSIIVELAVAIAANLPLESRDVVITYPLPGQSVQPEIMEVEKTGLPVLGPQKNDGNGDSDSDSEVESGSRKTPLPKDPGMVRFAGFVALEVRGRQVLMKAPVWTL